MHLKYHKTSKELLERGDKNGFFAVGEAPT
jgi:hypothetical protein